jgi:ribosomal protein S18 acetylase RimI-like enzyme
MAFSRRAIEGRAAANVSMTVADAPQRLTIPVALAEQGLALRPETEADVPFLFQLYVSTRWDELAPLTDWSEAQKIGFLESQFTLQRQHYLTHYANSAFDVLEERGVPVGRLYVDRQERTLLIVDIALLPQWRGRGIGTALIEALFAEARGVGKEVSISVEKFNPAQRLYRRLGFREYAEDDVYWFMYWNPQPPDSGQLNTA